MLDIEKALPSDWRLCCRRRTECIIRFDRSSKYCKKPNSVACLSMLLIGSISHHLVTEKDWRTFTEK